MAALAFCVLFLCFFALTVFFFFVCFFHFFSHKKSKFASLFSSLDSFQHRAVSVLRRRALHFFFCFAYLASREGLRDLYMLAFSPAHRPLLLHMPPFYFPVFLALKLFLSRLFFFTIKKDIIIGPAVVVVLWGVNFLLGGGFGYIYLAWMDANWMGGMMRPKRRSFVTSAISHGCK
jgi:hypothetical protein